MSAVIGTRAAKRQCTAQILIKRSGATGHDHLGNCLKLVPAHDIQRLPHMKSEDGYKRVDFEHVRSVRYGWKATLDEVTRDLLKLLFLGTQGSDTVQTSQAAQAAPAINVYKGKSYLLGSWGLLGHSLTFGGQAKTEGVDFTLDLGAGLLTILESGTIADNTALGGTINRPALTIHNFTAFQELYVPVDVVILHKDQISAATRTEESFSGQIQVTNWGTEVNGENFLEVEVELLATGAVTIKERKD